MTKFCSIILIFILSSGLISLSGQYVLEGIIFNNSTKEVLSEVIVYDNTYSNLAETDIEGHFEFNNSSSGEHELTIMAIGYETIQLRINLSKDTLIQLFMNEQHVKLSTIEIAAMKKEHFALKQLKDFEGTSIYAGKKTEVIVLELIQGNLASNNTRQVFAQIAGLNIYEGSDGGLQLSIGGRGLDPNRTSNFNTRQNGYDISADVLGYPENYYTPPSESLSEIQVIRGASSLQYGTQFGGLINFKTKNIPSFKKIEIESNQTLGSYNFFNSFNRIGLNNKKFSFNGFYNYKQGDGYRNNSEFKANNLFFNLEYRINSKSRLSADYTFYNYLAKQAGGLTDQMFLEKPRQSTRDRNWFEVNWSLFNLRFKHDFDARKSLSISLFGLKASRNSLGYRGNPIDLNQNPITALDEVDIHGNYISPRDLIKGTFANVGLESKFLFNYNVNHLDAIALIGLKLFKSNNTSYQGPGSKGVDPNFTPQNEAFPDYPNQSDFVFPNTNMALFSEHIFYLSDQFSITPGVRMEYIKTESHGIYNQVIFDNASNPIANILKEEHLELPRFFVLGGLGLSYKTNKSLNIYANLSQNYRSVTFSDIRIVSPTFMVSSDIKDETGFTADIGLRGVWQKKLSYDIGYYNIYYNDRIGVILDNRANRVRKNIGSALITGFESLIDLNIKEMFIANRRNIRLNLFANSSLTFSKYLSSQENNVVGKNVEFIPLLNIKTGLKAGYKDLLVTLQYGYVSSQYTDVQNSKAAPIGDIRSGIIGEIPAYNIFDLSLSYKFKYINLSGGINNIFNESYYTRRATGYPGPGIIPSEGRSLYLSVSYVL